MENINVKLNPNVILVAGTVNSVSVTFTSLGDGVWATVTDKASDGIYIISLTLTTVNGETYPYTTTIYKFTEWVTPKTDWTKDDYFNVHDAERIEINGLVLNDMLKRIGINVLYTDRLVEWNYSTLPYANYIARIKRNVKNMVDRFYVYKSTPTINTFTSIKFTFEDANAIEISLRDMYELCNSIMNSLTYCGAYTLGTENI